jgi:DNA-directed RNA polymerase specialized sigma24 family protein
VIRFRCTLKQANIWIVTDESTSTWPSWESLSNTFKDSLSAVQPETYNAAGQLWSKAVAFAKAHGLDESDARAALMTTVVKVSKVDSEQILSLPAYLFKSYKRRILETLNTLKREQSLDEINHELAADTVAARRLEEKVLLEEIVARMDEETLIIYEHLILGYSFEEIARKQGKKANVLRSMFSKRLKRISNEIRAEP